MRKYENETTAFAVLFHSDLKKEGVERKEILFV